MQIAATVTGHGNREQFLQFNRLDLVRQLDRAANDLTDTARHWTTAKRVDLASKLFDASDILDRWMAAIEDAVGKNSQALMTVVRDVAKSSRQLAYIISQDSESVAGASMVSSTPRVRVPVAALATIAPPTPLSISMWAFAVRKAQAQILGV